MRVYFGGSAIGGRRESADGVAVRSSCNSRLAVGRRQVPGAVRRRGICMMVHGMYAYLCKPVGISRRGPGDSFVVLDSCGGGRSGIAGYMCFYVMLCGMHVQIRESAARDWRES